MSTTPASGSNGSSRDVRAVALIRRPTYWAVLALLVVSAASLQASLDRFKITLRKEAIHAPDNRKLDRLPREVAGFEFVNDRREPAEIERELGTNNYVTRSYVLPAASRGGATQRLEFHAAYYTGMIDTVPHVPDRCFVGAGMLIDARVGDLRIPLDTSGWGPHPSAPRYLRAANESRVFVTLPREPEGIEMRTTRFRGNGGSVLHAGYFFVANGGWVAGAEGVRVLAFDRSSKYAYYLKVQFTSDTAANEQELAALAGKFLDQVLPDLMLCVPDWAKVEQGLYPEPQATPDARSGADADGKS